MIIQDIAAETDHERVVEGIDDAARYHGIVAIHSTRYGPAVGGTRMWRYPHPREALDDALRLSRGMTYKCSAVGLPFGGGKSVILVPDGPHDRATLLERHGQLIESLRGSYITGEDVGTSPKDMAIIRRQTGFVVGLESGVGDPSPSTASGVVQALRAASASVWGRSELNGLRVGIQGCGSVGASLARMLSEAGARLVVADIDTERALACASRCADTFVVPADRIFDADVDAFLPCAMGACLSAQTIPRLRAAVVVGAANNQLAAPGDAERLRARGILYVPDFIANAGGLMRCAQELAGWTSEETDERIAEIFNRTATLIEEAAHSNATLVAVAEAQVERSLAAQMSTALYAGS